MIDIELIRRMMPNAGNRLDAHEPFIARAMEEGGINSADRIAAFLAQLAHESGEYLYMEELADGSAYEGRIDLGNTQPGDGKKFKGHGPIQITGRSNTEACLAALGLPINADPRSLCEPQYATRSAVWFWTKGNRAIDLNLLADRAWFRTITRVVNGGYNGWVDRLRYYRNNRNVLRLSEYAASDEVSSIIAFQRANGLTADGEAGVMTFNTLKSRGSQ